MLTRISACGSSTLGAFCLVVALVSATEAAAVPVVLAQATAADAKVDPGWYVAAFIGATLLFMVFGAKVLFPNARRNRADTMHNLAERFPFLAPLVNPDAKADAGLDELRQMADEVHQVNAHKDGALQINSADLGRSASPVDETVDAEYFERRDLEIPTSGPNDPFAGVSPEATIGATVKPTGSPSGDQKTQAVAPRSQRVAATQGNDDIPFDAVSADVKPQMRPLADSGPLAGGAVDSTTVNVMTSADADNVSIGDVLRQSTQLAAMDDDETVVRPSGPQRGLVPSSSGALPGFGAAPDEPTAVRDDFDRDGLNAALAESDRTARENIPAANDPDAATNPFSNFDD